MCAPPVLVVTSGKGKKSSRANSMTALAQESPTSDYASQGWASNVQPA